jgi:phosphatidylglycerophosphate synthase
MLDLQREKFKWLETAIAKAFAVLAITPNQYTFLSIVLAVAGACFTAIANYWLAMLFLVLAAFFDLIDGAVARAKSLSTPKGAYWDTVADRYVEAIFLFGLLFAPLPVWYLPGYFWIFLALFGTTMTTYAKAAAKEKELTKVELKGGLMSRAERFFIYLAVVAALGTGNGDWAVYFLAVLAALANITALQRIGLALAK